MRITNRKKQKASSRKKERKDLGPRSTTLYLSFDSRLLRNVLLHIRIQKRENPAEKREPKVAKRQEQCLSDGHLQIVFLMLLGVLVIPGIKDLFDHGWVIGQNDVEMLTDCPADIPGFVDCPGEDESVAWTLMHGINEAVSEWALDHHEMCVETEFGNGAESPSRRENVEADQCGLEVG